MYRGDREALAVRVSTLVQELAAARARLDRAEEVARAADALRSYLAELGYDERPSGLAQLPPVSVPSSPAMRGSASTSREDAEEVLRERALSLQEALEAVERRVSAAEDAGRGLEGLRARVDTLHAAAASERADHVPRRSPSPSQQHAGARTDPNRSILDTGQSPESASGTGLQGYGPAFVILLVIAALVYVAVQCSQ